MAKLSESIIEAWSDRNGPVVLTTVSPEGTPNAIYASCASVYGEDTVLVADNYFDKTRKNIQAGSPGSVLFITNEKKSYQIKGRIEYHTGGPLFEDMKSWNPEKLPGHAVAALKVDEAYSGAERLIP